MTATTVSSTSSKAYTYDYDLKRAVAPNRLVGLWRLMTGFRGTYLRATLSLGMAALSKTTTLLLLRHLVDNILSKPIDNPLTLPLIALGFLTLALFEGSFTFLSGRLASKTAEGITRRLRNFIYDHLQRLPYSYFDKAQTGDMIQRSTSDVDAIRRFFADQAIGLGRIFILFGVNVTVLLSLHVPLTLISLICVPIIIIMSLTFFRRISKAYEGFQEQDGKVSTVLQENLSGVRVVKAFARQNYELGKFETENKERLKRGIKFMMMHSFYWPVTDIICGLQVVGGFLVGSSLVISGEITLGTFMAYVGLIWQVINPLRNLGRIIVHMSEGAVSYKRVMEIIKQDREPLDDATYRPETPLRGEMVFDDVSFEYEKGTPVLHNVSFSVKPGQMVALIGSTGSGKTSLVNLIPRFYDYTSGHVRLDNVELKDYARGYLRSQIGIVEQEPFLFSRSMRDNITYGVGREVSDAEVEAAARAAAVHDVILTFPEGYTTMVGEKGVTLSGGQKQRVAIARTLLKDPRILILDDATSSVDTETEAEIREAMRVLMRGRTSFVIAHRIETVRYADLILVFDKGRIVQRGTHDELVAQPGIYRQIFDVQTRIEQELEQELASV